MILKHYSKKRKMGKAFTYFVFDAPNFKADGL